MNESSPALCVLFDLDGLLVDSEPAWFRARCDLAEAYGAQWTEIDQRAQAGVHTDVWVANMRSCIGGVLSADEVQEEIVSRMETYYRARQVRVLDGADTCLAWCAERFPTALVSGSPHRLIDAAVEGAGWDRYFQLRLSSDDVARGKPAPDVYEEAMRRLGVTGRETVVLEDSGAGIRAGLAAGARVIAIPNPLTDPGRGTLNLATEVLPSLVDAPELLATWSR
ncbi:MAG: HAD family hydrolase [Rhodothermales bacterium]